MKPLTALRTSLLVLCSALCLAPAAAASFKIPPHYQVELVDGADTGFKLSGRDLTLEPGRHQLVLLFKDSFGNNQNERIISASNPIVIDIADLGADEVMTFKYNRILSVNDAIRHSRNQQGTLTDGQGNPLPQERASYFILTSDSGFVLMRSYRAELLSIGRLYAPTPQHMQYGQSGITDQGVPTVTVSPGSALLSTSANAHLDPSGMTYYGSTTAQTPAAAAPSTAPAPRAAPAANDGSRVKLNDLITMYNRADGRTREQFIKWINSQ